MARWDELKDLSDEWEKKDEDLKFLFGDRRRDEFDETERVEDVERALKQLREHGCITTWHGYGGSSYIPYGFDRRLEQDPNLVRKWKALLTEGLSIYREMTYLYEESKRLREGILTEKELKALKLTNLYVKNNTSTEYVVMSASFCTEGIVYRTWKTIVIDINNWQGDTFPTFDVTHLEGKKLSFLIGSPEQGYNDIEQHAIFQVLADENVVVDTVTWPRKSPERYTIDLTGVSELSFRIVDDYDGESYAGVAEITAWDDEPVPTGPAIDSSVRSMQLVKDLYPFSFRHEVKFHTALEVSREQVTNTYGGTETVYYQYIQNEPLSVAGQTCNEAIFVHTTAALIGERKDFVVFNTERQFEYLSFTLGCADAENDTAGSSWVVVYADEEKLCEELVTSNKLPRQVTLNIKNCKDLRFEIIYEDGGDHKVVIYNAFVGKTEADAVNPGTSGGLENLPEVCKLISSIKPYAVASYVDEPLFDGVTQHKTFSLAGRKYNEGIVLLSNSSFLGGLTGAHACFNLDGQFKYLTFTSGILDKTPIITNDTLKIYLDGKLSQTIELHALDLPKDYTVELKNCKELKIELAGVDAMVRPAYGLANMVVYKNEVVENDLFPEPDYDYPDSMPLVSNIRPYLYNYGPGDIGDYEYIYDGSKQHGFKIGDEWKHEGFLLMTSVHADLTGSDALASLALAGFSAVAIGDLLILAADVVYESSFAAFDLHGEFKKVTFTVACQERSELWDTPQTEILKIGSNDKLLKEIKVGSRMEPTTYTVDIENTEQLVFFLYCDPDTAGIGSSSRYAIYDITVHN